ncbi:hypothetical protein K439DRAFT_1327735 [Ramaria rubella]|nr:hypothetical protein K439DRAFT_1327735 [Ramaria rubella]
MSVEYPNTHEIKVIEAAEALMKKAMARYDPSHDAFHVQRVRKTALSLARAHVAQNPDLLVVELSALLHDVLDKKYVPAEQAADPYAFFEPFFSSVSGHLDLIADGRARLVTNIVDNVSWTTESKLRDAGGITPWHKTCIELHCVQDADRLDAIGAFGIMRCAAFSAATNRPLHVPQDNAAVKSSAIQHFYDKLLNIKERLKTESGKRLGEHRHQVMVQFLGAVEQEFNVDVPHTG